MTYDILYVILCHKYDIKYGMSIRTHNKLLLSSSPYLYCEEASGNTVELCSVSITETDSRRVVGSRSVLYLRTRYY